MLEQRADAGYSSTGMTHDTTRHDSAKPQELYPAEFHFRILVEGNFVGEDALKRVLAGHAVTAPLSHAAHSKTGRFRSLQVSVRIQDRAELDKLDAALRAVDGVKLLL